ncbi:hypothetical protein [Micromonospora sp. NPDC049679]|uniref:hypothetical protein n=1 Tax=Micromonospora sp. NPDC049679 TaxID=3155920 RepID=UPI0033D71522
MSQQLRQRSVATGIAMLFAAAPVLAAKIAYADPGPTPGAPVQESGQEVVFAGDNVLGVSCAATPSATSVTVPAESTLRVVNQTGRRARLLIDGDTQGEIAHGAAAEVLFHRGPVSLALKPNCVVAEESSIRVEVVPGSPVTPSAGSTAPSGPTGPGRTRPATPGTDHRRGGDESTTRDPAEETTRAVPDGPDASRGAEGSSTGSADPGDPTAVGAAERPAGPDADRIAAEPMASVEPVQNGGSVALLALIATVTIVGVSAGAIRAILAQRVTRTSPA